MKKQLNYIFLSLILVGCQSTSNISQNDDTSKDQSILFTVDGEPVYSEEFKYVYRKNNTNNDSAFTKKDVDDYLSLYKKFKLKIAEAKAQGIDTTKTFNKEFNTYKEQLKKPYLTESKVTETLIKEAYSRYGEEVNASHILIKVSENASPEDTLKAYKRLVELKQKAQEGASFEALAKEHSEDPSAIRNGGSLGYFTSFQMVYPFETAAYTTREGKISDPVRTRFGYHLVKVNDKRPSQGSVTVSHLMIRMNANPQDSVEARNKIFELYEQAVGGANWEQLIEQFSQDINSKNKKGILPPFKVGKMPYSFQEAAFSLEKGDFSDPVRTPFGWHIIRLENRQPLESFEQMEPTISARIKRDSRASINKQVLISRLKKENNFSANPDTYAKILSYADSSLILGRWSYKESLPLLKDNVFSITEKQYTVIDFFEYVAKQQKPTTGSPQHYMSKLLDNFESEKVIDYEENHLEEKYYDYKMLVKEYREGIMLFQLMEDEIWQRAVDDSLGLRNYYDANKGQYMWGERVRATIYNSASQEILEGIKRHIENGDTLSLSKKELESKYNQETPLTLQVESGVYEAGENAIVDKVKKESGQYTFSLDNRHIMVIVHEVLEPDVRQFNKIKGLVISDYQNKLEDEWLQKLSLKYPIEVNENILNDVYKALIKK